MTLYIESLWRYLDYVTALNGVVLGINVVMHAFVTALSGIDTV